MYMLYILLALLITALYIIFRNTHTPITKSIAKRLLEFNHNGVYLAVKLCAGYRTFIDIFADSGENSIRTAWNLYNLRVIRYPRHLPFNLNSSMSGPHHYLGTLSPFHTYRIIMDNKFLLPRYIQYNSVTSLPYRYRNSYRVKGSSYEYQWQSHNSTFTDDSLFQRPGTLILYSDTINVEYISEPTRYDFTPFKAQIVPNSSQFGFYKPDIKLYPHAQHKLRIITYHYGPDYLSKYIMPGCGIFLERHEFVQMITPIDKDCGGYILLGRITSDNKLELVATTIPFGCTLIVNPFCIHGDSTLVGTYAMAMTGNHTAMNTADTVFLKTRKGRNLTNVNINLIGSGTDIDVKSKTVRQFLIQPLDSNNQVLINKAIEEIQSYANGIEKYYAKSIGFGVTKYI